MLPNLEPPVAAVFPLGHDNGLAAPPCHCRANGTLCLTALWVSSRLSAPIRQFFPNACMAHELADGLQDIGKVTSGIPIGPCR